MDTWTGFLGGLLSCPFCLSPYVGLLCVSILLAPDLAVGWYAVLRAIAQTVVYAFAAARVANISNDYFHRWCRTPKTWSLGPAAQAAGPEADQDSLAPIEDGRIDRQIVKILKAGILGAKAQFPGSIRAVVVSFELEDAAKPKDENGQVVTNLMQHIWSGRTGKLQEPVDLYVVSGLYLDGHAASNGMIEGYFKASGDKAVLLQEELTRKVKELAELEKEIGALQGERPAPSEDGPHVLGT